MKNQYILSVFIISLISILKCNFLYGQQEIRFHSDRDYYFPGDTVWYKSYIHNQGQLDTAIRNIAVAFGKLDGSIIEQQIRPVSLGLSYGHFVIPLNYQDEEVCLNLYTKRQVVEEDVKQPKAVKLAVIQNKKVSPTTLPAVAIYVDGNGWMPKVNNNLKMQWNTQQSIKAELKSYSGDVLKSFETDQLGFVAFDFKADNQDLFLHWELEGQRYVQQIPNNKKQVRVLLKEENDRNILEIVNQSPIKQIRLQYQHGNFLVKDTLIQMAEQTVQEIDIEDWLIGRFNGNFVLRNNLELLANLRFDIKTAISPFVDVEEFNPDAYSYQKLNVMLPGNEEWNLSVSVHDGLIPEVKSLGLEDFFQNQTSKFVYKFLEIGNGTEANPVVYDHVAVLKGKIQMKPNDWERFLKLKDKRANTLSKKNKELRAGSLGYRLLADTSYQYEEVDFDAEGNLILSNLTFYDTLETRFVQIDDRLKTFNYQLNWEFSPLPKLEKLIVPDFIAGINQSIHYQGKYDPFYYEGKIGRSYIKTLQVKAKGKDPMYVKLNQKYSRDWFAENESDLDIDLTYENIPVLVDSLNELINFLRIKYPQLGIVNKNNIGSLDELNPIILLDNEYTSSNFLTNPNSNIVDNYNYRNIHASEVAYIRFYKNYPFDKFKNGAIMVYTTGVYDRNKDMGVAKIQRSRVSGYSKFKDYHVPNYDKAVPIDYDDRQTLFWNPDLGVEAGKPLSIEFYNNSLSKSYYLHIEGVSKSGKKVQFRKLINNEDIQALASKEEE